MVKQDSIYSLLVKSCIVLQSNNPKFESQFYSGLLCIK